MTQEELFDSLYTAKLHDSGNDYTEKDYSRFINQLNASFPKGIIDFSCQQIGMSVLTRLTKVLRTAPHIRKFNFYGNMITDHGLHSLYQLLLVNPKITVVDIGCNDISNQGVPVLQDIILKTNVTSLQLGVSRTPWHKNRFSTNAMSDLLDSLMKSPHMRCLGLSGIEMSIRKGARRLSLAEKFSVFLREYKPLRTITLSDCGFTPSDEDYVFSEGLSQNPRLFYIDASHNYLGDPLGPVFCSRITTMKKLRRIDLSYCQLSGESGIALAKSLKSSQLISLDISHNNIDTEGFRAILDVLKDNIYLTEFFASFNQFSSEISFELMELIHNNRVLSVLDISRNILGDECAFAIAEYLSENDSLITLDLSTCKISGEGAVAIAESVSANKTLTNLSFADNFLTRDDGYQLIEVLKENETLKDINLSATQIDHFVIQAARDLCKRNIQIQYEQDLQPLKKEMIQLSITRTKMPEAKARLSDLMEEFHDATDHIEHANSLYLNYVHQANKDIEELERRIQSKRGDIALNVKEMENMTKDGDKTTVESNQQYSSTVERVGAIQKQIEELEARAQRIENEMDEGQKKYLQEKEELLKEIEKTKKQTEETMATLNDEEKLLAYEPPEDAEYTPIFLVDQFDSGKKTSRSRASRKSKRSKSPKRVSSSKKTKRGNSPKKKAK